MKRPIQIFVLWLLIHAAANGAELHLLAGVVSRNAVADVIRSFEERSGHKLVAEYANNPIIKDRIDKGARFDVVVIESDMIDDLVKDGKVTAGSRVDLARVGMALLTRSDGPKPDIRTLEGFRNALKSAESIGYQADGHSGTVFLRTIEKMGVAHELKSKLRPLIGRACSVAVPKQEVQFCVGPSSALTAGVERVGFFPEEIQTYVEISAGLGAAAKEPDVARDFMRFLAGSEGAAVFKAKGYRPPAGP